MLFDRACKFAETCEDMEVAPLRVALKQTPIFVLDGERQVQKREHAIEFDELFVPLPPFIWCELDRRTPLIKTTEQIAAGVRHNLYDGVGSFYGFLLWDSSKNDGGPTGQFMAYTFECGAVDFERFDSKTQSKLRGLGVGRTALTVVQKLIDRDETHMLGAWICDASGGKMIRRARTEYPVAVSSGQIFAMMAVVNHPSRFVVKVSSETARPIQRGKIPRSDQRPRYILMPLEEIDKIVRQPNPANVGKKLETGHRRRGHLKRLRSDRFKYKQGQLVRVKPCWVGPKEGRLNGERYEVLTEL